MKIPVPDIHGWFYCYRNNGQIQCKNKSSIIKIKQTDQLTNAKAIDPDKHMLIQQI